MMRSLQLLPFLALNLRRPKFLIKATVERDTSYPDPGTDPNLSYIPTAHKPHRLDLRGFWKIPPASRMYSMPQGGNGLKH